MIDFEGWWMVVVDDLRGGMIDELSSVGGELIESGEGRRGRSDGRSVRRGSVVVLLRLLSRRRTLHRIPTKINSPPFLPHRRRDDLLSNRRNLQSDSPQHLKAQKFIEKQRNNLPAAEIRFAPQDEISHDLGGDEVEADEEGAGGHSGGRSGETGLIDLIRPGDD